MRIELPGFFDLQVNGFAGVDFNAPGLSAERVVEALERMRATGVTRCLPTLITSTFEAFAANARVLSRVPDPAIAGLHMEGPYISAEEGTRGAHPAAHVVAASRDDFERRQDAADGRIVLVTLAAESTGAPALIEHLVASGVRVAIGHSAASPLQIADAIAAGATLATHLGNGCAQMLPRHPNIIWELLAADRVFASLIADGHHLPPATVKAMVRAKGAALDDPGDGRHRRCRQSGRRVYDWAGDGRARRGRPGVASRHAVPGRIEPDHGSRDWQRGPIHRAAHRGGCRHGFEHSRGVSRHARGRESDRRLGPVDARAAGRGLAA